MLSLRDKLVWETTNDPILIHQKKEDWRDKPILLCGTFRREACRRLCELHTLIQHLDPFERPNYKLMLDLLMRALQDICPEGLHTSYSDPNSIEPHVSPSAFFFFDNF